ncbi:RNA polymerase sigma-70 factor (ECF subfamily) [Mycolicibacterium litorale]|nr:RNA polymerase sigma-70 factor (ECF subfamily) [Mycolicibacterium litorale]
MGTTTDEPTTSADDLTARFTRDVLPLVDTLYRAARRYTTTAADAEDLVQETLTKAYAGFHSYSDGTHMRAWLLRIMTNIWISSYRAAQRRPDEVNAEVTDAQLAAVAAHTSTGLPSAELAALEAMGDDDVRAALAGLPVDQRLVVYYADVEGLRYKEIAAVLDIPLGTVMSRLHRGRTRLRRLLTDVAVARGYLPAFSAAAPAATAAHRTGPAERSRPLRAAPDESSTDPVRCPGRADRTPWPGRAAG